MTEAEVDTASPMEAEAMDATEESRSASPPQEGNATNQSAEPSPEPALSTKMSPPQSAREIVSLEREREPVDGMAYMSGPKADKACARCKRHHKGCDKSLPVCSSCLKMFGEVGAAKRMCNYNYVVHPGRRIEEFTSDNRQTSDDSSTAAANARRKMELRRAEVDRLRRIVLHLCDRDLDIIPNIGKNDYSFLDPDHSKEYRVSAPDEFKALFKTDMWDWPQSTMDIVPLLIKDGIVSIVKPGEEKAIAEFSRTHYEKKAEEGKDGWEEQFGEKPSIEHWQHLVRRLENRNDGLKSPLKRRRVIDESDDSMDDVSGEVDNPDSNSFNPINGPPSSHPRIRLRLTNASGDQQSSEPSKRRATVGGETAELVGRYEPKASMPAFRAVRVAAQSAPNPSPRLRAQAANSNLASGAPPVTPRMGGGHGGSIGYAGGDMTVRDVLEGMERDIIEISRHAQTSTDDLVKAASRDACEDLRRKMEELRKVERDLMGSAMSPSAKTILLKSILKRLEN